MSPVLRGYQLTVVIDEGEPMRTEVLNNVTRTSAEQIWRYVGRPRWLRAGDLVVPGRDGVGAMRIRWRAVVAVRIQPQREALP